MDKKPKPIGVGEVPLRDLASPLYFILERPVLSKLDVPCGSVAHSG